MYAITGITGQVGGAMALELLKDRAPVRAVVRDREKGEIWANRGCEVAVATMQDHAALANAFAGADGVFILPPNEFDPSPGFPEARAVIDAVMSALKIAKPRRIVCLTTIGAQLEQPNLLTQRTLLEKELRTLSIPITFLRPAWFMENFAWDVETARNSDVIASFLQPLDRPIPMIATVDIGRLAAKLIQEQGRGERIVEMESERHYSPNDAAAIFSRLLDRPVRAEAVPRESWGALFKAQGMKDPIPRIQMLDGFNEGWIAFEGDPASVVKGATPLEAVLKALLSSAAR